MGNEMVSAAAVLYCNNASWLALGFGLLKLQGE